MPLISTKSSIASTAILDVIKNDLMVDAKAIKKAIKPRRPDENSISKKRLCVWAAAENNLGSCERIVTADIYPCPRIGAASIFSKATNQISVLPVRVVNSAVSPDRDTL